MGTVQRCRRCCRVVYRIATHRIHSNRVQHGAHVTCHLQIILFIILYVRFTSARQAVALTEMHHAPRSYQSWSNGCTQSMRWFTIYWINKWKRGREMAQCRRIFPLEIIYRRPCHSEMAIGTAMKAIFSERNTNDANKIENNKKFINVIGRSSTFFSLLLTFKKFSLFLSFPSLVERCVGGGLCAVLSPSLP